MLQEIQYGKRVAGEVIDFTQIECGGCGIPFMVPTRWQKAKVQSHGSFYCPNGCSRIYTAKTEAEKLAEALEAEKRARLDDERFYAERNMATLREKRELEQKLKRVSKGVCPCCNRSFTNLQRHMATKHPETKPEKK